MIRISYAAASKFKYITQSLAKINDEGFLVIGTDMLAIHIMSPDKTTMAIVKMPPISFDEYSVDESVNLLFRTDEFNKVVKRATRNDDLIIEYDVEQEALKVSLRDRKTGLLRQFYITAHPDESFKLKEPSLDFAVSFGIMADDFKTIIQDAKVVGDTIEFDAEEEQVRVHSEGEEREYEWLMKLHDPLLSITVSEPSRATYTRSSLEVATKPTGAADNVKVSFSTDFPMKVEFTFPNGEKMDVYVAPSL
ncbi:MAG: DNA polymerase sliding clamp [Desulfurococcales archaeon]|nr:DNA polymerase sliding clamp [Desulfurococcales archaeon]